MKDAALARLRAKQEVLLREISSLGDQLDSIEYKQARCFEDLEETEALIRDYEEGRIID